MPNKDPIKRAECIKRCHDRDPNRKTKVRGYLHNLYLRRQALVKEAKNRPCMDCKISYPSVVMDFDHRPGTIKSFTIGDTGHKVSIEALLLEIAKCDVVCANCHRIRTFLGRDNS